MFIPSLQLHVFDMLWIAFPFFSQRPRLTMSEVIKGNLKFADPTKHAHKGARVVNGYDRRRFADGIFVFVLFILDSL